MDSYNCIMHHRTLSKEIRSVIFRYEKQLHHQKGVDYTDDARKQPKVILLTNKITDRG